MDGILGLKIKLKNLRLARADAKKKLQRLPDDMDLFRVIIEFESEINLVKHRINSVSVKESKLRRWPKWR